MRALKAASSVLVRPVHPSAMYPNVSKNTSVVLLGWALARDENLAKYAEIYVKEGISTLRYTSPFPGHRRSLKNSRDVSDLANNLRTLLAVPETRLALHLFSMNAIYSLCALSLQYPELNILGRTDGIIFDRETVAPLAEEAKKIPRGCPILFEASSPQSFANLASTLARTRLQNASLADNMNFLLFKSYFRIGIIWYILEQHMRSFLGFSLSNFTPYHFLLHHPQLPRYLSFIYSDADLICPPRTIQLFHEAAAKRKKHVDVLRFIDSEHVEHYKKYPAEYTAVIHRFLSSLEQD